MGQSVHYEIFSRVGARGGWKLHDVRDGRDVAVKVLPESFATDADRLRRF